MRSVAFNPVYGQGMTSAALQVAALEQLLERHTTLDRLWHHFFKRAAAVVSVPWQLCISEDFRFPHTQGDKPFGTDLLNAYGTRVHQRTHTDPYVYAQFARVFNLQQSPASLLHPRLLWKSLASS